MRDEFQNMASQMYGPPCVLCWIGLRETITADSNDSSIRWSVERS